MFKTLLGARLWALLLLCCSPVLLIGQTTTGTILGAVKDPSGAALPGAKVTVTDVGKGTTTQTQTDQSGEYNVPFLIPGTYTVSIEKEGFTRAVSQSVTLEVDQKQRVDVALQVGAVSQTLEVNAAAPLVQADSAELGQVINQRSVEELPLNGRNFAQLVYLVPGVTQGQAGENLSGASTFNPRAASDFNALGSQANANAWLVDGIVDNEYTFNTVMVQPSVESVQEFKVLTGSYSAEFGRGAGVVTTSTRSGSNAFHGDAFEFLRNSYLDSRSYFNAKPQAQPPYKRNQFGASVAGRIIRDKTFFFADYYGWREVKGQTFLSTVPTAQERIGDFSQLPVKIYQPGTGVAFAGNVIPAPFINPVGQAVASLYPLPNLPGTNGGLTNNYVATLNRRLNDNGGNFRIDHHFSEKDSAFVRWSYEEFNLFDTKGQGGCCIPTPAAAKAKYDLGPFIAGGQNTVLKASGLALNETHVFTPSLVSEFIGGFSRTNPLTRQSDYGHNAATSLGINGINLSPYTSGLPVINISNSGFGSFTSINGGPAFLPANPRQTTYQLQDNISWTLGKHNVKFGYRIVRDDVSPFTNSNTRGALTFNNGYTAATGDTGAGNGFATLLLGYLSNGTNSAGSRGFLQSPYYLRVWEHAAWVQDDYKVSPRLTLNLGVRWDLFTPYTEKYNHLANFDLGTLSMLYPGVNSNSQVGIETRYKNFGPHIGFAYDVAGDGKTVLRGGYNMSYFPEQVSASNFLGQQVPYAIVQNTGSPATTIPTSAAVAATYPTINQPFPAPTPLKPVTTADLLASVAAGNPTVIGQSRANQTPYYETWNLDIEHQLGNSMLIQLAYAGSRGVHLMYCYNPQEVEPGTGLATSRLTLPQLPTFRNITECDPRNSSNYHGMQASLTKRLSAGLQFNLSYTWSKSLDYGGSAASGGGAVGNPQTITNLKAGYGPSGFDATHRFVANWLWELPFGQGRQFASSGLAAHVLGGWEIGGIGTLQTGLPFSVVLAGTCPNGASSCWPDLIGNPAPTHRDYSHWFNPTAFMEPCNTPEIQGGRCSSPALRYGNVGRGILRNPNLYDFDLFVQRTFKFTENTGLQFRIEAFNALNHPNLGYTGSVAINGANPAASNIAITSTETDNRDLEIAAKFTF